MSYIIDTNVLSSVMRGQDAATQAWRRTPIAELLIPVTVLAEGLYGAQKCRSQRWLQLWQQVQLDYLVLPFDDTCAEQYAHLRTDLEAAGTMIGLHDCEIAATALARQQTHPNEQVVLVTDNTREFARVPGLQVENWVA